MNKVILLGRLGKEPELKYTASGDAVCNFSIATGKSWKDKDGNKKDKTEWHSLVSWKKQAEIINQYFKKGDMILIEGELQTRSWDDKEGKKQYKTEILVSSFNFVPSGKKAENQPSQYGQQPQQQGFTDEDVPF